MSDDGKSKVNNYPTIKEQKQHFRHLSKLPLIISIITVITGVLVGIAMSVSTNSAVPFLSSLISSAIAGLIVFAILRILLSAQMLTVLYLEKISKNIEKIKNENLREQPVFEKPAKTNSPLAERTIKAVDKVEVAEVSPAESEEPQENKKYFVVEKEPDIRKEVVGELVKQAENSSKEEFFGHLKKWMKKYQSKLMFWDVDIYNEVNNYFNETQFTVDYDGKGNKIYTYNIDESEHKKIVDLLKQYYETLN